MKSRTIKPQGVYFHQNNSFLNRKLMPGQLVICSFEDSSKCLCKHYENHDEVGPDCGLLNIVKSVKIVPETLLQASDNAKYLELVNLSLNDLFSPLKSVDVINKEPVEFKIISLDLFIDAKHFKVNLLEDQEAVQRVVKGILTFFTFTEGTLIDFQNLNENYGLIKALIIKTEPGRSVGYVGSRTVIELHKTLSWTGNAFIKLVGNQELEKTLTDLINFEMPPKVKWHRSKFLLIGPSGTGKTSLIKNLALKLNCYLLEVVNNEVIQSLPGDTEHGLRSIFEKAHKIVKIFKEQKVIIFIRNIESFCPRDVDPKNSAHIKRVSLLLMNLLEDINSDRIIVLATTSNIEDVNLNLRRPGRINEEFFIKMPDQKERQLMLSTLFKEAMEGRDVVAHQLSFRTNGYVAADLALLVKHFERGVAKREKTGANLTFDDYTQLIEEVLRKVRPSIGKGEFECKSVTNKTFDIIGGMTRLKQTIRLSVLGPLENPEVYARFGLSPPKGILLYGPPGCAKTTFAQCIANETHMSFLSTSAAEVYSPYVGKAERYIVKMFNQARAMAPAIIFLDEIDALVGSRSGNTHAVQTRILSALLTEMDGIGGSVQSVGANRSKAILVIAATNRPDMIDEALMRPGRFDKLIHVPAPDEEGRLAILQKQKERIPLAEDVDLEVIAKVTNNFSGADIVNLCNEAALVAATENLDARQVTTVHFSQALEDVRPSLMLDQIKHYETFECRHRGG